MRSLTQKEKELLKLIAQNKTTKEISEETERSVKTIENHRGNICKKLQLKGTNSLLRYALLHQKEILKIKTT